jgi:hypothetical protein
MTVIVDQDTGGGASPRVVVTPEVVDQRDEQDTVMLQQPPPAQRGETVGQVAGWWPGPTIQLDES